MIGPTGAMRVMVATRPVHSFDHLVGGHEQRRRYFDVVEFTGLCRPPNYAELGRFPQISR